MGNCIRQQLAVSWAEDDEEWEWEDAGHQGVRTKAAHGRLLGEKGPGVLPAATEVKIKITRKQLEELLRKADAQDLPLEEVLSHLMSRASDVVDALHDRARHWRPALQSIPEAAES